MKRYFKQFPEIIAIMSEKNDDSMILLEDSIIGRQNIANRKDFLSGNGIRIEDVVSAQLEHGNQIKVVGEKNREKIIKNVDGLVTLTPGIFLAVTAADCVPIFFYDSVNKIVALSHSGWKGSVSNIVKKTVEKIVELGGNPENLYVTLGPGINDCHYDIKGDRLNNFFEYPEFLRQKNGKTFVNLKGIIKKQLIQAGIKVENIEDDSECTFCSEKLFSHHRDRKDPLEVMVAIMGIMR